MRSRFLKELQYNQEVFVNSLRLAGKGSLAESFYCEYMNIPIMVDEAVYLSWQSDSDITLLIRSASDRLGLSLSLSIIRIGLYVQFPYKGFYCNRDFYGELRRQVVRRIQMEFGNRILLDDEAEEVVIGKMRDRRERINKMILDDLDS